jgi:hypothetical protein
VSAVIVRYRVKPGHVEENAELVRAVYAELAVQQPPGFRYATSVDEDGHDAPLPHLPAFQRFRRDLAERCDEPPQATQLSAPVGSYRL